MALTAPQDALICLIESLDETHERILLGIPKEKWKHGNHLLPCGLCHLVRYVSKALRRSSRCGLGRKRCLTLITSWRKEDPKDAVL